jgi:putative ABC transport system permease protein
MTLIGFAAVVIILLYLFFGTEMGCSLRATGCNLNMSRAQGINTSFNKVLGLVLSNGLVALSGALLAQYQGFADINMGRGAIVIGLAAVIIGDAIFSHISINFGVRLAGVAAGGVIYYIVYQVVVAIGLDPELLKMLSALVVTIFLAIPYVKKKYFSYTPQFKAERKIRKVNAKLAKKQAQLAKKAHDKGGKA